MSNVSGAAYSTLTPMSLPAWSTPFLKIDQNGSDACPWVTTSIRMLLRFAPPPPLAAGDGDAAVVQAVAISATAANRANALGILMLPPQVTVPGRYEPLDDIPPWGRAA